MSDRRILVMGFGSPLWGNDAVGIVAIERLRGESLPGGVDLLDGGVRGIDLLARIQDYRAAIVIDSFVDQGGRMPEGALVHTTLDGVALKPRLHISLHELDLGATLLLAQALKIELPPIELVLMSVGNGGGSNGLSSNVRAGLPDLIQLVRKRVDALTGVDSPAELSHAK